MCGLIELGVTDPVRSDDLSSSSRRDHFTPATSCGGWRAAAGWLIAFAMLAGCQAEAKRSAPPEPISYSNDRVRFPATDVPALLGVSSSRQPLTSLLNIPRPLSYGDFVWNDRDVAPGKVWVLVDLTAQTMSVFRGGDEIGRAVTLYGVDDTPTPIGRFTVLERRRAHVSNLYDAPMPYTLRLTNDGVAIHGSDVQVGIGTHGCLGVPTEFGAKLFEVIRLGGEVLILADATAPAKTGPLG
jgi:hypothetical protein